MIIHDIPSNVQKPNPFGGLKCLEQMFDTSKNRTVFYIGDHEGDVQFARNIEMELGGGSRVIAVVAKYSGADTQSWSYKPDFEIEQPIDLLQIINHFSF